MGFTRMDFTKRAAAFGLTAALALGGMPALTSAVLAEEANAADSFVAISLEPSTTFTFSDSAIEASGSTSGYKVEGTELTIQAAGMYRVTGSCADGMVSVKKGVEGVTLVLDNLTLAKDADKAIKFKAGSSGAIVLVGVSSISTTNDKGIIKANAVEDDNEALVYASDGTTTGGDLVISGDGTLNLSSDYTAVVDGETEDCDAINCEGDLTVLGGTFNISVTDDAMHADNTLTIGSEGSDGPIINVTKATEGLEGASVNLLSGTGDIVTSDDGVNAANSDLVSYGWQYGINVAGGNWKVVAAGDGLDSNGNLTISGGTTEVYCTGNGNGALDYGEGQEGEIRGTFTVTGGTLFAVGSDMMVVPSEGNYVVFGGQGAGAGMAFNGGQPGLMGQGQDQQGLMSQGQAQDQQGQQLAAQGQQSAGTVVTKGETVSIVSSGSTLYETVASASGSYALFASDSLGANAQATLQSGSTSTSSGAAAGQQGAGWSGSQDQPGQQPSQQQGQQQGQQPGETGQNQQGAQFGQQPGQDQQPGDQGFQLGQPAWDQAGQMGQTPPNGNQQPAMPGQNQFGQDQQGNQNANTPFTGANGQDQASEPQQQVKQEPKANTMKVRKVTKTVKRSAVKKSAKTVKAITVASAKGKVTYTKKSGSKYLKVNKTTGKITVKKGTPAGTYKVKVTVKAAGTDSYKPATKTVTVKVKVK